MIWDRSTISFSFSRHLCISFFSHVLSSCVLSDPLYFLPSSFWNPQHTRKNDLSSIFWFIPGSSFLPALNTKWIYSSHIIVNTPQMPWPWTISVRIGLRRGVGSLWSKSEFQGSGPNHHTSFLFWVTFHLSSCLSLLCYFLWSTDLSETQDNDFQPISTSVIKLK